MNTPLEIMAAIVANGGPKKMFVSFDGENWIERVVSGIDLESRWPILTTDKANPVYSMASIENPNKTYKTTRPMTPREFARFVGENIGKFLYRYQNWYDDNAWTFYPDIFNDTKPTHWFYAENAEGELEWKELPQVEVEG